MSDIEVRFRLRNGDQLDLSGCERVKEQDGRPRWRSRPGGRTREYPSGTLTLVFPSHTGGGKELAARSSIDDGAALTGTVTVTIDGVATEYSCGFMGRHGDAYEFTFACIRDD